MNKQIDFYKSKLAYETDSADLFDALQKGENIVVAALIHRSIQSRDRQGADSP